MWITLIFLWIEHLKLILSSHWFVWMRKIAEILLSVQYTVLYESPANTKLKSNLYTLTWWLKVNFVYTSISHLDFNRALSSCYNLLMIVDYLFGFISNCKWHFVGKICSICYNTDNWDLLAKYSKRFVKAGVKLHKATFEIWMNFAARRGLNSSFLFFFNCFCITFHIMISTGWI